MKKTFPDLEIGVEFYADVLIVQYTSNRAMLPCEYLCIYILFIIKTSDVCMNLGLKYNTYVVSL